MPMGKGKKNPQYMHTLSSKKLEGKKKKPSKRKNFRQKLLFCKHLKNHYGPFPTTQQRLSETSRLPL
jgi:hypothetical protein